MKVVLKKIFIIIVNVYFFSVSLAAIYFNENYIRIYGFKKWLQLGEIITTAKAFAWPIFLESLPSPSKSIKHFIKANEYSNQAVEMFLRIKEKYKSYKIMPKNELDKVAWQIKIALEEGKRADIAALNYKHSGLGDHFYNDLIRGIEMFIEGHQTNNTLQILGALALIDQWASWHNNHINELGFLK